MVQSIILIFLLLSINVNSQTMFYGNGTVGPYQLNDKRIFVKTDSVFINDSLISQDNYQIDYNQGLITFEQALSDSDKVMVRYKKIPFTIEDKYFIHTLQTIGQNDSVKDNQSRIFYADTNESDLELTGSKTISIDIGNKQGTGLDQATRIDIKGNLQGVEVLAQLSDVGNPILPEGTTKELAEFDKVLISLKTDKYQALYGDNDLIVEQGVLGTINKKVLGVLFKRRAESEWRSADLGYAKSKGKYKKIQFYGKDNKQGPYFLTTDLKNSAIIAGSENVYLFGKRMIRGQNQDYTIDYSQGSITFTNRQIINSFSRIEVDFEYTSEDYNQYLWLVNSQWHIADGLKMGAGVFSESDDKSQNLFYTLTNSDIEYLKTVSFESSYAWLSGVKYVGWKNGDYIKQGDTFIFAGIDSGDYDVQFSYVGFMAGNYDYDNTANRFHYVGENQGRYVIGVRVQLPEQNRIYNANLKYDLPIGMNFNIDGYFSQRSNNLFAAHSKNGFGYLLNSGYNKERFKLNYRRREFNNNFYFPGTYQAVDFNYAWAGIKQESLKKLDEIDIQVKPIQLLTLIAGSGWIKSFNNAYRQRYCGEMKISQSENFDLANVRFEYYPNRLKRYSIRLAPKYKIFYPGVELFLEKANANKQRYLLPSFEIRPSDAFNFKFSSDLKELVAQNKKLVNVYKIETEFSNNNVNLTGLVGYQNNKSDNILESENFFGNLSTQFSVIQGLSTSIEYLEQQGETQKMEVNYVWVGLGLGNFKKNPETQEYYPDPNGDYIQEMIPTIYYTPSRTRNIQANWNFYRWQFINFDGFISYNRQSAQNVSLQAINNQQLNFSILPFEKDLSARIIHTYNYSIDNYMNIMTTQKTSNNNRFEINTQKIDDIPMTISFELNHYVTERINVAIEQERKEEIVALSPSFGFGINIKSTLSFNRSVISKPLFYGSLGRFYLYKWQVNLERNWELNKLTNLFSKVSLTRITSSIAQLPYDINLYEPIGLTPELKINLDRIIQSDMIGAFKQLILGANYSFLKYPSRAGEHNFSMKLQANF